MTAAQTSELDLAEQKSYHQASVRVWPLVAVVGGGVGGLVMSWSVAGHSLIGARWHFVVLIVLWVPAWVAAAAGARRLPVRWALVAVLVLAVLLRLAAASGTTASISNDAERYAWDGHVQLSGTDPYRYPPAAPQLDHLRTAGFWPSATACRHLGAQPGCTLLNRPNVRTIYPAVAEAWFVAVDVTAGLVTGHGFDGGGAGYRPWQLAGGLVDDLAIVLMILLLRSQGRDPRAVVWYALSPVAVIEFAGNGHVDGVSLALLLGAFLALRRDRPVLAGILIGAATMVKLYPGAAVVAGWRQGRWRLLVPAVAVMVVSEAPHVAVVGARVLGYLPGYLTEEHYGSGGRFLLLDVLHLPARATIALAVLGLAAAMVVVLARRWSPEAGTAFLLVVLIGVTTPVQPWYTVAVAGLALAAGVPCIILIPLLAEGYYASVVLNSHHQVIVGRLAYGLSLAVVAALVVARGIGSRRRGTGAELLDGPAGGRWTAEHSSGGSFDDRRVELQLTSSRNSRQGSAGRLRTAAVVHRTSDTNN